MTNDIVIEGFARLWQRCVFMMTERVWQNHLAFLQEAPCLLRVAAVFYSMSAMEGARTLVDEAPEKWELENGLVRRDYRVTRTRIFCERLCSQ